VALLAVRGPLYRALMSTKSREVIWGGRIMGAKIRAQGAREDAVKAVRAADRAEAEAWSVRMEGTAAPRSRRRPSGNASTAVSVSYWGSRRCQPGDGSFA
jgi:hypothetical protein